MTRTGRWVAVAVAVLLLVGVPALVRARPAPGGGPDPVTLAARIADSGSVAWSGYATSRGGVTLPEDESLTSVARLLGRSGPVRVWWSDADTWRVAALRTTGETVLVHDDDTTTRWVFESKRTTVWRDVPIRLPNAVDVVPSVLARRLLDGAEPGELSRLPAERIAGRVADGLRLVPADVQSSVGRVDVWADRETGLPLRVELFGETGPAVLSTSVSEVGFEEPDPALFRFRWPEDSEVSFEDTIDLASAADRYADRDVPATLAGLPRRRGVDTTSVGVYGRGPTLLLAVPLRSHDALRLRDQLLRRPGARCDKDGATAASGPLRLFVTSFDLVGESWLLAGTVTDDAAVRAARDLVRASADRLPQANGFLYGPARWCP